MKEQHKILILSMIIAVTVWVADAAIDSLVFQRGPLPALLFTGVSSREFSFRLLSIIIFILFAVVIARMILKHRADEKTLKKLYAAMKASMDGVAVFNENDEYIYVNDAYAKINGYDSPRDLIGKTYKILYDAKELERIEQNVLPVLRKRGRWQGELTGRRKDGSTYRQEVSVALIEGGGRVCVSRDITVRKRSEEKLHRSERFLSTIFDSIRDPFSIVDNSYRIVRVNDAYAQMRNKSIKDLVGRKCYEILQQRNTICEECVVEKTFQSGDPCAKDKPMTYPDGTKVWVEIFTYPIFDGKGRVSHVIEYTRDVTDRKKVEEERKRLIEELEYLSTTDGLTALFNRRALIDMLRREMERAYRYGSELSLVLCDIDNFKEINDTYGHAAGDRALQTIAKSLKESLRKSDIVGRHGGDEFMLILPETSLEGANSLAEKIRATIEENDFKLAEGKWGRISLSMGVTNFDAATDNLDTLVKRADKALYASKQAGRNRVSTIEL